MEWLFFPVGGLLLLIVLLTLAFRIWMLADVIQRPAEHFSPPDSRIWWIVGLAVGLFLSFIGFGIAVAYYFIVRKPAIEGRLPQAPLSCRSCGARLAAGARFCHSCGSTLSSEGT